MSNDSNEKNSPIIEFLKTMGVVLGVPIALFTIINSISEQPIISLVVAIITGIVLSVWLAYSRKINLSYLVIAWLSFAVIILLGFVVWPKTMTLEGFVTYSDGKPVFNETIQFFDYTGRTYETQTSEIGFYQFVDVPTGKYRLRVRTTEIKGETKGVLVRVVQQSLSVPLSVDAPRPTPTFTPSPTLTNTPVLPTHTPVPEPTNTHEPTNTPQPSTFTPTPTNTNTPRPTSTPTTVSMVYDDFNNSAFDGKYDPDLWEHDTTKHIELKQENGVLSLKTMPIREDGANNLVAISQSWTLQELGSMEAKLKIDSSRRGKGGFVKIQAVVPGEDKIIYWIECQLDNRQISYTAYYCNYEAGEWPTDNLIYDYQTEIIKGKYDTWYVSRFEIDPETLKIQFFLDDKLIGSYTPKDTDTIRKKRVYPLIGSWTGADEDFIGYIDDVRIGQ